MKPDWLYTLSGASMLIAVIGASGILLSVLIEDIYEKDTEGLLKGSGAVFIAGVILTTLCLALWLLVGGGLL